MTNTNVIVTEDTDDEEEKYDESTGFATQQTIWISNARSGPMHGKSATCEHNKTSQSVSTKFLAFCALFSMTHLRDVIKLKDY